jgi:hypothetical protein
LENLTGLGGNVIDTTNTNNEDKLLLSRDVVVTLSLGLTAKTDFITLDGLVFSIILGSTLEKFASLGELSL